MRTTERFVLLVTRNSKGSIWIPWELGLADGTKGVPAVAIFPVAPTVYDQAWSEQEYLGIYLRIVHGDLKGHPQKLWMVLDFQQNTGTPLADWLRT